MKVKVLIGFRYSPNGVTSTWLKPGTEAVLQDEKAAASLVAEGFVEDLNAKAATKPTLTLKK